MQLPQLMLALAILVFASARDTAADPVNLLRNPGFGGNLAGWILDRPIPSLPPSPQNVFATFNSTANASGALSGSARSVNNGSPICSSNGLPVCTTIVPLYQCVLVQPGKRYEFGAQILIPPGRLSPAFGASVLVRFLHNANCDVGNGVPESVYASSGYVRSAVGWTLSIGQVLAPPWAVSAEFIVLNARHPNDVFEAIYDDLFFQEALAVGIGPCGAIRDPGLQVPVTSTGWTRNYRNGTKTMGFRATNVGATAVQAPFVQVVAWQATWSGTRPTVAPTTECFGSNPMPYVPLKNSIDPGETARANLVFRNAQGILSISAQFRPFALAGLQ